MNEALQEAAKTDPKWARKQQRQMIAVGVVTVATLAALGVGVVSLFIGFHNETRVTHNETRVTKIESPCQRFGSNSERCQEAFETAVASINHRIACFIEHQAGDRVAKCVGVRLLVDVPATGGKGLSSTGGGGAPQTGSTDQQPAPSAGGAGKGGGTGHGGSHGGGLRRGRAAALTRQNRLQAAMPRPLRRLLPTAAANRAANRKPRAKPPTPSPKERARPSKASAALSATQ